MKFIETVRPSDLPSLDYESLWYDAKRNSIYCFGGDKNFNTAPPESIWAFKPTGEGSGVWQEVFGPASSIPFPQSIHRISSGASTYDSSNAYYLGGFASFATSQFYPKGLGRLSSSGLLKLDFDALLLTNSSDGGYIAPNIPGSYKYPAGAMINIPTYNDNDLLIILPSGSDRLNFAFNNVTLYDKRNEKWYFQMTSGDIPGPRTSFCATGIGDKTNSNFEM